MDPLQSSVAAVMCTAPCRWSHPPPLVPPYLPSTISENEQRVKLSLAASATRNINFTTLSHPPDKWVVNLSSNTMSNSKTSVLAKDPILESHLDLSPLLILLYRLKAHSKCQCHPGASRHMTHLSDTDTYRKLSRDPAPSFE